MTVKSLAREVTPPFLWNLARQVLGKTPEGNGTATGQELPEFEWVTSGNDSTPIGYAAQNLVDAPARHFPELLRIIGGPQPFGCRSDESSSDLTTFWHQQVYPFAYILGLNLPHNRPLKILDWGGGLGIYCHIARILYPEANFDYHIHELPEFAHRGPEFTPQAHFHSNSSDWEGEQFDLVMASGSLQYAPDWRQALRQLTSVTGNRLYLARTPVLFDESSPHTIRHRPRSYGYESDVLFHVLPRRELMQLTEQGGLKLVREMIGAEEILVYPDQKRIPFRGFLFQKVREQS